MFGAKIWTPNKKNTKNSQNTSGGFERKPYIFKPVERDQPTNKVMLEKKIVATLLLAL
jgi:hypothetical protein